MGLGTVSAVRQRSPARGISAVFRRGRIQHRLQLIVDIHLAHDVATADKLSADIQLRNGRPVGVDLDALTNRWVRQNIETGEGFAVIL